MKRVPGATSGNTNDELTRLGATSAPGVQPDTVQSAGYLVALLMFQDTYFKGSGSSCQDQLTSKPHHKGMAPTALNSWRNGIKPDSLQKRRLLGSLMAPRVILLPAIVVFAVASQAVSVTSAMVAP